MNNNNTGYKAQINVANRGWLDCVNMPHFETVEQAEQWLKDKEADKITAIIPVVEFQIIPK